MKQLLFKSRRDFQKGKKALSSVQMDEDQDCKTKVHKSFSYNVIKVEKMETRLQPPQVRIIKNFDTQRGIERFRFVVKGSFCVNQNRYIFKVHFRHTLNIQIQWKTKVFSPKKSEVLT